MPKPIRKHKLIGRDVAHQDTVIRISEAWERKFTNPNHPDLHNKMVTSIAGFDMSRKYRRVDIATDDLILMPIGWAV